MTDNGFYYDFDCPISITPDDLGKIAAEMRRIIKANLPIIREEVQREEIRTEIAQLNEPYKLEILDRIPQKKPSPATLLVALTPAHQNLPCLLQMSNQPVTIGGTCALGRILILLVKLTQ